MRKLFIWRRILHWELRPVYRYVVQIPRYFKNIEFRGDDNNDSIELNYLKTWERHTLSAGVFWRYRDGIIQNVKYMDGDIMKNTYINISHNRRVNELIKKATGLANLDALFLSKSEVDDFFRLTLPF